MTSKGLRGSQNSTQSHAASRWCRNGVRTVCHCQRAIFFFGALEVQVSAVMLMSALIRSEAWAFARSGKNNDLRAEKARHSEASSSPKNVRTFFGIREKCTSTDFSAPARPLSRVIGDAEAGVLLSIYILMIFMLNIGKARQLLIKPAGGVVAVDPTVLVLYAIQDVHPQAFICFISVLFRIMYNTFHKLQ